jgi:hypothetical protein
MRMTDAFKWLSKSVFNNNLIFVFSSPSPPMTQSPPPAHTSPVHSPVVQNLRRSSILSMTSSGSSNSSPPPAHRASWINPYNSRLILDPPQNAPEDLRVIARKIDFKPEPNSNPAHLNFEKEVGSSEEGFSDDHSSSNGFNFTSSGRDEVHECSDCGKAYSTSSNLARHRQTHRLIYSFIS